MCEKRCDPLGPSSGEKLVWLRAVVRDLNRREYESRIERTCVSRSPFGRVVKAESDPSVLIVMTSTRCRPHSRRRQEQCFLAPGPSSINVES